MSAIKMRVGESFWTFEIADHCLVTLPPKTTTAIGELRKAVSEALEHPLRLGFPLRRALTPDDRITLVIDEHLPRLGELLIGVLEYLVSAGIGPSSVTILSATDSGASNWIDELPDEFADVHTEVHQAGDRKLLGYLATTKKGRRIYLNRTLLDADQVIVLSGRRYDPLLGYAGAEGAIYPALGDDEARHDLAGQVTMNIPSPEAKGARAEAAEVALLLSSTIYLQVIEGEGDEIEQICSGMFDSSAEGIRLLDERWRFALADPVDVVLASVGGNQNRLDFSSLAQAAVCASRAVKQDGVIVILSEAEPVLDVGMQMLQGADEPASALRMLYDQKTIATATAFAWTSVAEHARIYLASGLRPEIVEEIFATAILSPNEVQRLLDRGGRCLCLPDAHKSLIVMD